MAALLVGFFSLLPSIRKALLSLPQIFKIVAPYVILSAVFATLNARLHLPPFSLFIVALTLTDGGWWWYFWPVIITDFQTRDDDDIFLERHRHRWVCLLWGHIVLTHDHHVGSWLEIGQSISFFCITSLLLVWSAGICAAGEYLVLDTDMFVSGSADSRKIEWYPVDHGGETSPDWCTRWSMSSHLWRKMIPWNLSS